MGFDNEVSKKYKKPNRRSIACVNCHKLKVRCLPSLDSNISVNDGSIAPCIRCLKANKVCVYDTSQKNKKRKRRTKAEIEASKKQPRLNVLTTANEKGIEDQRSNSLVKYNSNIASLHIAQLDTNNDNNIHSSDNFEPTTKDRDDLMGPTNYVQYTKSIDRNPDKHNKIPNFPIKDTPINHQKSEKFTATSKNGTSNFLTPDGFKDMRNFGGTLPTSGNVNASFANNATNNKRQKKILKDSPLYKELMLVLSQQRDALNKTSKNLKKMHAKWDEIATDRSFGPCLIDPLSSGLLTEKEAKRRLDIFRIEVMEIPHLKIVLLPEAASVQDLVKNSPILFTAIMTCASIFIKKDDSFSSSLDLFIKLEILILRLLSQEVLILGNKSVELLKSLLIMCVWYNTPELFQKRRYHILNSICCCLLSDIGLNGRQIFLFDKEGIKRGNNTVVEAEGTELEYEALCLLVYVSSLNINLYLRKAIHVRWSPILEKYCLNLKKSASLYHQNLLVFTKMNKILEKIHMVLHKNSQEFSTRTQTGIGNNTSLDGNSQDNNKNRFNVSADYLDALENFQLDLNSVFLEIPKDNHRLLTFFYSVEAYLHEPSLTTVVSEPELDINFSESIIDSVTKCTYYSLYSMKEMLQIEYSSLVALPLFYSSRLIYTVGMLLRIRYISITVSSFYQLQEVTAQVVSMCNEISRRFDLLLSEYPYNNIIGKLKLVISLFLQTYATQIKKAFDSGHCSVDIETVPFYDLNSVPESSINPLVNTINKKRVNNDTTIDGGNKPENNGGTEKDVHVSDIGNPLRSLFQQKNQDNNDVAKSSGLHDNFNIPQTGDNNLVENISGNDEDNVLSATNSADSKDWTTAANSLKLDVDINKYLEDLNNLGDEFASLNSEFWGNLFLTMEHGVPNTSDNIGSIYPFPTVGSTPFTAPILSNDNFDNWGNNTSSFNNTGFNCASSNMNSNNNNSNTNSNIGGENENENENNNSDNNNNNDNSDNNNNNNDNNDNNNNNNNGKDMDNDKKGNKNDDNSSSDSGGHDINNKQNNYE
ncbi:uncharacterized protein SCODWIG_00555 [Saccharomycodes ludwigii]|uniref:Zn(2)-C6 fungal-type domain-containing protein n=1 Tax=Saccharomycodes ludwigii TaxID=36035 RepID=A0A376B2T7_9ASCO|nr:hypothetical protein SCDLUD_004348 [Saccharomycodes ludwigii]KAH3900031.1 hypothetical protein SCDLUD_004348 [Saccharomycodes ludwigii]SSD58794.1 uncharacterized protein SCODWIG_00555 [Saccharomycodes ludwigii]